MRNFLKLFAVAAVLVFGIPPFLAQAEVVTNTTDQLFNAVDEVSATITVPPETDLTIFISGTYSVANIIVLQREVGSPGSGAWQTVQTISLATANARETHSWKTGTSTEGYRLNMTATGTGAVVAYLTDRAPAAPDMSTFRPSSTQIVFFDDFTGEANDGSLTVINPSLWVSTQGVDSQGTIGAVSTGAHEGGMIIVSGGAEAGSEICFSPVDETTSGVRATDGEILVEFRVEHDQVDGLTYLGLQELNCTGSGTLDVHIDIAAGVFDHITTNMNDMIVFARQDEATDTDDWQAASALVTTEGANALEVPLGTQTVANDYVILRIVVDTTGNGYWYINGVLVHAEPLAVTVATRLVPVFLVAETAGAGGTVTGTLDYILLVSGRPTSS